MGIYDDCRLALEDSPPSTLTALEREVLYARLRAFSVRIQYVVWNIAGTVLLYLFSGSLLNAYFINGDYYIIIIFHLVQIISFIAYFKTSLADPGYIDLNDDENALFDSNTTDVDTEDDEPNKKEKEKEKELKDIDGDGDADGVDCGYKLEDWNKNIIIDPNNA
eukprot:450655_1